MLLFVGRYQQKNEKKNAETTLQQIPGELLHDPL